MAALPYMQLYIADYLADTMHLSTEEHGAYLLLMFNYWQTGRAIPKNRLAKIARVSNERWGAVEESLREFFIDNGTEWVHKRIEDDLASVRETLAKRSAAGKASVHSRRNRKETQSASESNTCSTGVGSVFEQDANKQGTNKDTDPDKETDLKDQNLLRGAEKISPPQSEENLESCGLNLHDGTRPAHAGPERRPLSAGVPEMPRPDDPEFIRLPLNDGSEFPVTESLVSEFEALYPAVDVRQALRNQRGWLLSDQRRRKTARGIKKFITGWLAKDQDRGGNRGRDSPARIQDLPPPDSEIPPGFRG
ncbi:TPA: YdaU family protein [Salmonella enterica subsp. diarizonae serovar 53:z10:z35]